MPMLHLALLQGSLRGCNWGFKKVVSQGNLEQSMFVSLDTKQMKFKNTETSLPWGILEHLKYNPEDFSSVARWPGFGYLLCLSLAVRPWTPSLLQVSVAQEQNLPHQPSGGIRDMAQGKKGLERLSESAQASQVWTAGLRVHTFCFSESEAGPEKMLFQHTSRWR